MSKNFNVNTKNHDEWLTPPEIIKSLGNFTLDPCQPINPPWKTAQCGYNKLYDGLKLAWFGRIWLNPPYGRETFKWLEKLAAHKIGGGGGIALIAARTETIGFHRQVWEKADAVFFFEGRLVFHDVYGQPARNKKGQISPFGAPSCLIAYGAENVKAIENSGLKGKIIYNQLHGSKHQLHKATV